MASILVTENQARTFITNYSSYSDNSVTAVTNKLITCQRVKAMGGHLGTDVNNLLVDTINLRAFQVPPDKMETMSIYFSKSGGFPVTNLILSRRVHGHGYYDGINGGGHPTISYNKNTSTSSDDNIIGGYLWDQLSPSTNLTIDKGALSTATIVNYKLSMSTIPNTTYGVETKYYYIGQIQFNCGSPLGSKYINLYYRKSDTVPNSVDFRFNVTNNSSSTRSYVNVVYKITGTNYSLQSSVTISSISGNSSGYKLFKEGNFSTGVTYTIQTIYINWTGGGYTSYSTSKTFTYPSSSIVTLNMSIS